MPRKVRHLARRKRRAIRCAATLVIGIEEASCGSGTTIGAARMKATANAGARMRSCAFVVGFAFSAIVHAEECPESPAITANECLSRQLKSAEAAVAKSYGELLSAVPVNEPGESQTAKGLLARSQRAWLAHRKASCSYRGFVEGGAAAYKVVRERQCLVRMTEARAAELRVMQKHYE